LGATIARFDSAPRLGERELLCVDVAHAFDGGVVLVTHCPDLPISGAPEQPLTFRFFDAVK
jgi:hypothetical protein